MHITKRNALCGKDEHSEQQLITFKPVSLSTGAEIYQFYNPSQSSCIPYKKAPNNKWGPWVLSPMWSAITPGHFEVNLGCPVETLSQKPNSTQLELIPATLNTDESLHVRNFYAAASFIIRKASWQGRRLWIQTSTVRHVYTYLCNCALIQYLHVDEG